MPGKARTGQARDRKARVGATAGRRRAGRLASALAPVLALVLGACASPGLSYTARSPAGDPVAAAYRTVAVGYFSGPEGEWYTGAFETMLLGTQFDGGPWFIVHHPGAPEGTYEGHYSGQVDIVEIDVWDEMRTRQKCVEWDGLFDCEHRAEVLEACLEVEVAVAVTARLTDVGNGAIRFQQTYHGRAAEETCEEVEIVSGKYAGRRKRGDGHFGWLHDRFGAAADDLTVALVREALGDTLDSVRRDIAPRNGRARAPLVAEAVDPEVRADPRFAAALAAAGEGDAGRGCALFAVLGEAYPAAPGVRHNLGACAEAAGDTEAAEAHYAAALEALAVHPGGGEAEAILVRALGRISRLQLDAEALAAMPSLPAARPPASERDTLCSDCITSPPES